MVQSRHKRHPLGGRVSPLTPLRGKAGPWLAVIGLCSNWTEIFSVSLWNRARHTPHHSAAKINSPVFAYLSTCNAVHQHRNTHRVILLPDIIGPLTCAGSMWTGHVLMHRLALPVFRYQYHSRIWCLIFARLLRAWGSIFNLESVLGVT